MFDLKFYFNLSNIIKFTNDYRKKDLTHGLTKEELYQLELLMINVKILNDYIVKYFDYFNICRKILDKSYIYKIE